MEILFLYSGENIASAMDEVLERWNISKDRVHLVLRDNAASMKKAMRIADLSSLGCFAHSLQLCINDAVLISNSIKDLLSCCRRIVGHFKHSSQQIDKLALKQSEQGLPNHRLIQDVVTRWNSSYYMLQRLVEHKQAIALLSTEDEELHNLSAHQWQLAESILPLLAPFEEVTKLISSKSSTIAEVIPSLRALRSILNSNQYEPSGTNIQAFRISLIAQMDTRFYDIEKTDNYTIATFIDPRFRTRFFDEFTISNIKINLHQRIRHI